MSNVSLNINKNNFINIQYMHQTDIIQQIYNSPYKDRLFQLISKLLNDFKGDKLSKLTELIKSSSDKQIFKFIKSETKSEENKSYTSDETARDKGKAQYLKYLFDNVLDKKIKVSNLLDIGCNRGKITVELKKAFGLSNNNAHCIEMESFSGIKIVPVDGFTFKLYDGENIPYSDNTFDLITMSMVYHHVQKQEKLISEIKRILKPNGIIIIKEHNMSEPFLSNLIDLEHLIYSVVYEHVEYDDFFKDYYANYCSLGQLIKNFTTHGFKVMNMTSHVADKLKKKYFADNPTNYYFITFSKVD